MTTKTKSTAAIQPTVGRIVHFYASEGAEPSAAIVTYVGEDDVLNLCVLDRLGTPQATTAVPLVQPGDDLPAEGHYAAWPEGV